MNNEKIRIGAFSVLMSVYCKEKPQYLSDCLESIYASTLLPQEIILVKDGPLSHELNEVIKEFENRKGFKTISLEYNSGLGIALNVGLSECCYDLIARMDADDICEPERFEKQYEHFKKFPELCLLGGCIIEYDASFSTCRGMRKVPLSYQDIISNCYIRNPFNHMTVMFRKSKVLSVGGYKHHPFMEDYNLWLRLIASGYIVENLSDILVKARTGDEMIRRRGGRNYVKSEYELMKLINELKITNKYYSFSIFATRSLTRFLPANLLGKIYSLLRR